MTSARRGRTAALAVGLLGVFCAASGVRAAHGPDSPVPGEWPKFKRDLGATSLAADMAGAVTASNACVKWSRQVGAPAGQSFSSPLIGAADGGMKVFVVVAGACDGQGQNCAAGQNAVFSLNAADGSLHWRRDMGTDQVRPMAPVLADLEGDGGRELVTPSINSNRVFALRAGAEDSQPAGSIEWTALLPAGFVSEAAPTAVDLDGDGVLEVLLGTDAVATGQAATFVALDGRNGSVLDSYAVDRRNVSDPDCTAVDKADSSNFAIIGTEGNRRMFAGAWDGYLYALGWSAGQFSLLGRHALPPAPAACSAPKVRTTPAAVDLDGGGQAEVVFGYMDPTDGPAAFSGARTRSIGAVDLALKRELVTGDWKSSPAVGDLAPAVPGLEVTAGRAGGVYSADMASGASLWSLPYGDGFNGENRSTPAVADIDGDGDLEIVIGITKSSASPQPVGLFVLSAATGQVEWTWPTTGVNTQFNLAGVLASPAVGDLDGDGELEIVFLDVSGTLFAIGGDCSTPDVLPPARPMNLRVR